MEPVQPASTYRPRHAMPLVREALADTRVVLIAGPRQAGKSTLARMVLELEGGSRALNLDDEVTRRAALEDPVGLLDHDGLTFIDEVQRAPDLLLAIKVRVDRVRRPGQFLLTGSANVLQLPRIADALPGRMAIIDLWPFSQGELTGRIERFVERAFAGWQGTDIKTDLGKRHYLQRAVVGGFPEVVERPDAGARARWFDNYLRTMTQRDLPELSNIERADDLARLIRLLAARSGRLFKVEEVARDAGIPTTTARRYVALLQAAFLISIVPAWANSRTTRAIHAPKVLMTDTGLMAHAIGADVEALSRPGGDAGPLLETFVGMELRKSLAWSTQRATIHHFRTKDGTEVDLVLETPDGRIVGIEVKAAATVRSSDFLGLRHLQERLGDRFVVGLVLYTGTETLPFGDRLRCTPLSALWQA
jgi:predicted AAA+ superfamily ATPase